MANKEIDLSGSSFLITGGAGFIGSNIVDYLMGMNPKIVRVLDDLSNGFYSNISKHENASNFEFVKGDIRSEAICTEVMQGIDYVSHQAALGSVPRSINNPILTNSVNIDGFLNVITAAKNAKVKSFVYASSSSVYGDSKISPKKESNTGKPLSPYAVTKATNEIYANAFAEVYGFNSAGLRYFNIFGPKQDPNSQYSAVIPLFIKAALANERPVIFGDGSQSRDFTYVGNAVQANIRALLIKNSLQQASVYNIAVGESTSLIELWEIIAGLANCKVSPEFREPRTGDVKNSLADISLANTEIGYAPEIRVKEALETAFNWYKKNLN